MSVCKASLPGTHTCEAVCCHLLEMAERDSLHMRNLGQIVPSSDHQLARQVWVFLGPPHLRFIEKAALADSLI